MSEQQPGGIRRVTRKDRKRKIETGKLEFPPDDLRYAPQDAVEPAADAAPVEPAAPPPGEPDVEASIEEAAVETAPVTPAPPAERFPPLEYPPEAAPPARQRPAATAPPRRNPCLYNLLTLVFLLLTVAVIGWIALVWTNPYTPLNPLAPFTPLPVIITTTPLPATPTLSPTPSPTDTLEPTPTFTPLALAATRSPFPFVLVDTGMVYAPNGNGQGCAWASIAGSVTDANGAPLNDYQIRVEGDDFTPQLVRSGAALTYGAGGFEMPLGDAPRDDEYRVQLLDPDGSPVSDTYTVTTRADCDANVAIVSFVGQ
ncbi:MAG: hypothetical protein HZC41_04190 [Chloroflexi bacterium]|nr:hypothetical protein [Chloroflexota bacterium]